MYHGHNYMKTCVRHSFGDGFILVQCALCMPPVGFVEANYILRRLCRLKHQTWTSRWWWQKRLQLPQHLKAVPVLLLVNRADSSEVDDRRSVIIQNWSSLQRHLRQDNRSVLLLSVCIEAFTARVSASSSVGDIHRSIYSASLCEQFCRWHSSKHWQRESLQAVLSVTVVNHRCPNSYDWNCEEQNYSLLFQTHCSARHVGVWWRFISVTLCSTLFLVQRLCSSACGTLQICLWYDMIWYDMIFVQSHPRSDWQQGGLI